MVAGLAPLFAPGEFLRFLDVNGRATVMAFDERLVITCDGAPMDVMEADLYTGERRSSDRVAVLVDGQTWSSGEATMVALASRSRSRSFGSTSGGFASSPESLMLVDGGMFRLPTVWTASPGGTTWPTGIEPDVPTSEPEQAARAWLGA